MKKQTMQWIVISVILFWSNFASAITDLMTVYQTALLYDPTFQAAVSTRLSTREAFPQARANLLPLVGALGSINKNYISGGGLSSDFVSRDFTLNVSQPLFNYQYWATLKQATSTVKQADAAFFAAAQALMVRTAATYFNVLLAEDNLEYTTSEKLAYAKQLDEAKQRYEVGLDPVTSMYDAQSRYDSAFAAEISATNALKNARESLREITGQYYEDLAPLRAHLPLIKPVPTTVESWVKVSKRQNFNLQSALFSSLAARDQIKINFSGHLPTVNAVAQYDAQKGEPFFSAGAATFPGEGSLPVTQTKTVGLTFSMPIYQGGAVNSQVRQARYNYRTSNAQLERAYRTALSQTRQSFNNVMSGIEQVKADRKAIVSAKSSLDSSQASYLVGTRTFVDVLDAQSNLYNAERQLASDQYTYLNSILALKQAAGTLSVKDMAEISNWLDRSGTHRKHEVKGIK